MLKEAEIVKPDIDIDTIYTADLGKFYENALAILPPELLQILDGSEKIQRFSDLGLPKEYIEEENVRRHTLRLLLWLEQLDLDLEKADRLYCLQMLMIHDLPETKALLIENQFADVSAVTKANSPDLGQEVERNELEVARKIFNPDQLNMYLSFSSGSAFIKGKEGISIIPDYKAIICSLLDKIDADLFVHYQLSKNPQLADGLTSQSQVFAFVNYANFNQQISTLESLHAGTRISFYKTILKVFGDNLVTLWEDVDDDLISPNIKTHLASLSMDMA